MDLNCEDSKLCIICCVPFVLNVQTENVDKISKFCEHVSNGSRNSEGDRERFVNFTREIKQLNTSFGMAVCPPCFVTMNEVVTSKENASILEDHVISLQKQILKGLRDLEKIVEKIKCQRETIQKTVKDSDAICLKNRFLNQDMSQMDIEKANESKNFVFKMRQFIRKGDQSSKSNLDGNLSIPESEAIPLEKTVIKVEEQEPVEDAGYSDDHAEASYSICDDEDKDHSESSENELKEKYIVRIVDKTGHQNPKVDQRRQLIKRIKTTRLIKRKKIYKCTKCDKTYSNLENYKCHKALHENKGYKCKVCGKITGNISRFRDHMWTHSEEKQFTCEICGKGLSSSIALNSHMKMHERGKDWKCEDCGRTFARKDYLTSHLRIHTGERPFACEFCGKDFRHLAALSKHKKFIHPN